MPGQATVTINENQWNVWVANTYTELTTGLSGRESIPPGTGMLFILEAKRPVTVDTSQMLFPIDIIFISETVIDVASNIQPGYLVTEETPCDMFLEVNAGEASGVESGDTVSTTIIQQPRFDLSQIISFAIPLTVLGFVCAMAGGMARLMGGSSSPKLLPQTSPEITSEEWRYAEGMWQVTKEDAKKGEIAGVYLWSLVTKHYPDDREKQIRFMGFMNELLEKHPDGRVPREDAVALAKKWDVVKALVAEVMEFLPQTKGRVVFIGSCKLSEGLCVTHGYSVSQAVRCPKSPLTDEEWKAAFELVKTAFPEGQPNPWVNGWWPETLEEAEKAASGYARKWREAVQRFREKQWKAIELYERSANKAIYHYRQYVMREYERRPHKELAKVIPVEKRPRREGDLEYLADSPEFLTQTIEAIGYRDKLDTTFQEAIARAKGLKQW